MSTGRDMNLSEGYKKPLNKLVDCQASPAPLPKVNMIREPWGERQSVTLPEESTQTEDDVVPPDPKIFFIFEKKGCFKDREDFSLYLFPPGHQ